MARSTRDGRQPRGGLRPRARADLRPSRRRRRAGRAGLDPGRRPGAARGPAACPSRCVRAEPSRRRPPPRRAYFGRQAGWLETPVAAPLGPRRSPRAGPLIVEEYDATCVVPPGGGPAWTQAGTSCSAAVARLPSTRLINSATHCLRPPAARVGVGARRAAVGVSARNRYHVARGPHRRCRNRGKRGIDSADDPRHSGDLERLPPGHGARVRAVVSRRASARAAVHPRLPCRLALSRDRGGARVLHVLRDHDSRRTVLDGLRGTGERPRLRSRRAS